jgi:hypothetical protein
MFGATAQVLGTLQEAGRKAMETNRAARHIGTAHAETGEPN